MKVTNISTKPIYIGMVKIFPDQTVTLGDDQRNNAALAALVENKELRVAVEKSEKPTKAPSKSAKNKGTTGGKGASQGGEDAEE